MFEYDFGAQDFLSYNEFKKENLGNKIFMRSSGSCGGAATKNLVDQSNAILKLVVLEKGPIIEKRSYFCEFSQPGKIFMRNSLMENDLKALELTLAYNHAPWIRIWDKENLPLAKEVQKGLRTLTDLNWEILKDY